MGRNWHSPKHFDFADSSGGHGAGTGGHVVVKDREGVFGVPGATLVALFNDSFEEAILAAYQSGRHHGERVGAENAKRAIRDALAPAE